MTRDNLFRVIVALLVIALAAWLVSATEWADEEVPVPPRGEAAKNRFHALQGLLRGVGAQVVRKQDLDALPPPRATLVLDSAHWKLFPERAANLRNWVAQGGQLVIPLWILDDPALATWIPLKPVKLSDVASLPRKPEGPRQPPGRLPRKAEQCSDAVEPEPVPATYAEARTFRLCSLSSPSSFNSSQTFSWAIQSAGNTPLARVPVGQGSVTAIGPWVILGNAEILEGDNALVAVAALQAARGTPVWFVVEEARAPLLAWLWENAWIAMVLSLAALAAALWRGAVRFGPLAAGSAITRRSMAEQISGTGQFLMRHGAPALHRAQVRALDEAARRYVRNYNGRDLAASLEAISRATGLDAVALGRAIAPKPAPAELPQHMELLETARRRLQLAAAAVPRRSSARPAPPTSAPAPDPTSFPKP